MAAINSAFQAGDSIPNHAEQRPTAASAPFNKRIGKPGSKRYQRFMNKAFLLQNEHELEEEDLIPFVAPTYTALDAVFEEHNKKKWEPFIDTTEERERRMLHTIAARKAPRRHKKSNLTATARFGTIKKKVQKILEDPTHNGFVSDMDSEICSFIKNDQFNSVIYNFDDEFSKSICQATCQYYQLTCFERASREGRAVCVKKTNQTMIPGITLLQYAYRERHL